MGALLCPGRLSREHRKTKVTLGTGKEDRVYGSWS